MVDHMKQQEKLNALQRMSRKKIAGWIVLGLIGAYVLVLAAPYLWFAIVHTIVFVFGGGF